LFVGGRWSVVGEQWAVVSEEWAAFRGRLLKKLDVDFRKAVVIILMASNNRIAK
jgi:hypothetical protein